MTPKPAPTTTLWVPLTAEARGLLGACRREAERREPGQQPPSDTLYAGLLLEHAIRQAHKILFPRLIVEPHEVRGRR